MVSLFPVGCLSERTYIPENENALNHLGGGAVCACNGPLLSCETAYCCGVISRRVFTVNTGEALHDVPCCYFVDSINVQTGSRLDTDEHQQALTFKLQGCFFLKGHFASD